MGVRHVPIAKKKAAKKKPGKRGPKAAPPQIRDAKIALAKPDALYRAQLAKDNPGVDVKKCIGHSYVRDAQGMKVVGEDGHYLFKPCEKDARDGMRVCANHGGRSPQAIMSAERTLNEYRDRAAERLIELAEQNDHLPTALGATVTALKQQRVVKDGSSEAGGNRPLRVVIGVQFGGMNPGKGVSTVVVTNEPPGLTEPSIEAEVIDVEPESA